MKPKSTNLIEPGEGFVAVKDDSDSDDALAMFDQFADRKFAVRRGRNNRILTKAIVQNIFEDNVAEQEEKQA